MNPVVSGPAPVENDQAISETLTLEPATSEFATSEPATAESATSETATSETAAPEEPAYEPVASEEAGEAEADEEADAEESEPDDSTLTLTAYVVSGETLDLEPAPARRLWMEQTSEHFANRCLPLLVANQSGWLVTSRHTTRVTWDGTIGNDGLKIEMEGDGPVTPAASHFGNGILTWTMPWLFRTPPGWNLLVRGPANWPIDGAQALEGLVETDWSTATFTMNWKLTRPGLEVVFPAGDPICMIVPQQRGELESFRPTVDTIGSEPTEYVEYSAWRESRLAFNAELMVPGSPATKSKWQRDYFLGNTPAAKSAGHQRRRRLHPFPDQPAVPRPGPTSFTNTGVPAKSTDVPPRSNGVRPVSDGPDPVRCSDD